MTAGGRPTFGGWHRGRRPRRRITWPGPVSAASVGRRRVLRRQLAAGVLAVLAGLLVHRGLDDAATARAAWEGGRRVLVLRSPVGAGSRIRADDVEVLRLPSIATPSDAVAALPGGATAAIDLGAGTAVGRSMVSSHRRNPVARSLGAGRVAVVVRTGDLPSPATPGDVVDVTAPDWAAPVATGAHVIREDGDAVTLAVREVDASATATAGLAGPVALVLRG